MRVGGAGPRFFGRRISSEGCDVAPGLTAAAGGRGSVLLRFHDGSFESKLLSCYYPQGVINFKF